MNFKKLIKLFEAPQYKGTAGAQAIAQASGVKNVNKIMPGQVLNIPGQTTPYTVKKGDTLDAIARRNPATIAASNTNTQASISPSAERSANSTQDKKNVIGGTQNADAPYGGAAANAMASKPAPVQTNPDQISTTSQDQVATSSPNPSTGQSSYTSPTGVALGADQPEEPGSGLSGYTSTAGAAMGRQGQSAMSSGGGVVGTNLAGDTNIGTRDYSKADMSAGNYMRAATKAVQEESDIEEDELSEEQLEEAFNDMLRLSGITLNEKAVSKQQQKFMGMVHAMQKGKKIKGASPELKKAAKGMSKKAAKDFAKTKHKDLPQRVSESVMLEAGNNLEHIVTRFKHETKNFLNGAELDDDLYNALFDYYLDNGEMPYGVAKAREGDPYQWVSNRFDDALAMMGYERQFNETVMPVLDNQLSELARLAGLSESRVDECGNMSMKQEDSFNVSTNMSSDGTKSVNISAQGDKADELLSMLKLAGMQASASSQPAMIVVANDDEEMMEADRETEYSNTPDEEYQTVDSIIRQGNDLNREKRQYADKPKLGDNPMAESILDEELQSLLDSIIIKDDKNDPEIRKDPESGRIRVTYPPPKKPEAPDQSKLPLQTEPFHGPRTATTRFDNKDKTDEGVLDNVSNFVGDIVGTEASKLRSSQQLRDLDAMRKQYKPGSPEHDQVSKRYDTHLERLRQDKGEVVDKTGEPIKVLPPEQWKGK